ncbi:Chaperone protein DnaJ 1 [Penicillium subrubescens]|uniref:Chaperone protein DnaJ 1 n=1 Tax=Penicillium subrubescens TaxID=1316194 RepID=A0A1Q5U4F5_9EURO|nr:Chaperone protein DnaJ 1 [Penicillium subrubescens]
MAAIPQLPDYYGILQVSWDADTEAIKSSWKRLALARHPDKNPAKNAVADFQLLHEAYSILIDPSTRQAYDAKYRAFTSTDAPYSSSQSSRKTPDKNGEHKSMQELQSMLERCDNDRRGHELRLNEAHANLMRLHTELARLKNEVRSLEQEKASGQTIWSYLSSFLPGGESRITQQRQERDRLYLTTLYH